MSKVVFVSPHPDDIEIFCGGALLEHVRNDDQIIIFLMTKGGKGTLNPFLKESTLEKIRAHEAHSRYQLLSNAQLMFAGFKDKKIECGKDSVQTIIALLRPIPADIIYIPEFNRQWTHYHHRDHIHSGEIVYKAAKELKKPVVMRCYHSKQTNLLIDIKKEQYEENNQAIKYYKSQNHLLSNSPFVLSTLNFQYNRKRRQWGKENGSLYAEGFREFNVD